ncbi:MAG: TatD family nuclease-associated radical SAM protein [Bacillota bacterium]
MAITYQLGSKLYINLTNNCTNNCKFCVRQFKDGLGGYELWIDDEPTVAELIADIGSAAEYSEVVFCGFGEPLLRVDTLIKVATWVQDNYPAVPVRINTNGLANLVHDRNVLQDLEGIIDSISISMNASNPETYQEVSQSKYGAAAFEAVLEFITEATEYIPKVQVSVVDYPGVDVEQCRKLAQELGVEFKLRHF